LAQKVSVEPAKPQLVASIFSLKLAFTLTGGLYVFAKASNEGSSKTPEVLCMNFLLLRAMGDFVGESLAG
jgi:hypothetical protein